MRRHPLAVVGPALVVVGLLAVGCAGSGGDATPPTTPAPAGPPLGVCTDAPYEVFEYGEPTDLQGFDVELVELVGSHLDRPVTFTVVPLDQFPRALADGTCDLAASALAVPTAGGTDLAWSRPYLEVDQALVVRDADAEVLTGAGALAGRPVGVVDGSPGADLVAGLVPPGTPVTPFPTWSELIEALRGGTVDAALGDGPLADRAALVDGGVVVVQRAPTDVTYALAVAPSATGLLAELDTALAALESDGELPRLRETWFGR